jgi:aminopeptidase N
MCPLLGRGVGVRLNKILNMKRIILFVFTCFTILNVYAQEAYRHVGVNATFAKTYDPRSDSIDILKYTINLNISDITGKKISGSTTIKLHPKINNIHYLNVDLLRLSIDSIKLGNNTLGYHYNDTLLSINLNSNYQSTDTISVTVFYKGTPQGDPTGWGGFYFQSGYAYNLGVGFGSNPHVYGRVWFPCFDNFTERSTYEFNIKTIPSKSAYCNGELISDTIDSQNLRTRRWVLNKEIPTYLASVAVGTYVDLKMSYVGVDRTIPILIATTVTDSTKVKASLIHLKDALHTYEKFFGPYVWNRVGYALVPFNQGAMEHATNIAFPISFLNGGVTTYEEIAAHELSHHWFGDYITCSSQEEMWINEGWASYCEYLFREEVYGKTAYINGIKTLHESLLHFVRYKEGDLNLNNIPFEYTYGDHVYLKGAIMAHNLRGYLGDSLFSIAVKQTLLANAYKSISNEQFQQSLSTASGVDLSYFFEDWIYQPGWAHFSIDSVEVSKINLEFNAKVFVRQMKYANTHFDQHVPMQITFFDKNMNSITRTIMLNGEYSIIDVRVPFVPVLSVLNMNDKISQAISSEQKMLKNTGVVNFVLAKMNVTVNSNTDSSLMRIEHHYTGPQGQTGNNIQRISPQRYWTVSGILSNDFKASTKFSYDGRSAVFSGNNYLDHQLNITNEDSLVLLYRKNTSEKWTEYPYYTKNTLSSKTDKYGNITIDSLRLGEYCLGMGVSLKLGLLENKRIHQNSFEVFPNPSSNSIEITPIGFSNNDILCIYIYTNTGELVFTKKQEGSLYANNIIDISKLPPSNYILKIELKNNSYLSKTFVISK